VEFVYEMEKLRSGEEDIGQCSARMQSRGNEVGKEKVGEKERMGEEGKMEMEESVCERRNIERNVEVALDEIQRRGEVEKGYVKKVGAVIVEKEIRDNIWVRGDRIEVLNSFRYLGQDEIISYGIQGLIKKFRRRSVVFEVNKGDTGGELHERRYEHVVNLKVEVSPHEGIHDSMYED